LSGYDTQIRFVLAGFVDGIEKLQQELGRNGLHLEITPAIQQSENSRATLLSSTACRLLPKKMEIFPRSILESEPPA
jgi:hypothetical protein